MLIAPDRLAAQTRRRRYHHLALAATEAAKNLLDLPHTVLPKDHLQPPWLEVMMVRHGLRGWVKTVRNYSSHLGQDRENRVGQDREKLALNLGQDREK
jgi:hypothetical protein